ncbi:hypothetical protein KM043_012045 [Ampulex compressa]|nr:hypothetical protein KM043_012045 [Ampulex compressa]
MFSSWLFAVKLAVEMPDESRGQRSKLEEKSTTEGKLTHGCVADKKRFKHREYENHGQHSGRMSRALSTSCASVLEFKCSPSISPSQHNSTALETAGRPSNQKQPPEVVEKRIISNGNWVQLNFESGPSPEQSWIDYEPHYYYAFPDPNSRFDHLP